MGIHNGKIEYIVIVRMKNMTGKMIDARVFRTREAIRIWFYW